LLVILALAGLGPSLAQNVLGIDFGSEWIKLAVVQRSAGVQIVLNEVTIPVDVSFCEHIHSGVNASEALSQRWSPL
jgi:hypothetical protein